MAEMDVVTLQEIEKACSRIKDHIHLTPVMQSHRINEIIGRNVFFKCEHLQKTGSFKLRGALNSILAKRERLPLKGVTTTTCGNHGQAVAFVSKLINIPSIIVVPEATTKYKCNAIEAQGGHLVYSGDSYFSRYDTCDRISQENGYEFIPSSNDYDTIAGQATLGPEFLKQVPQLDAVLVSIAGGSLASGCALAFKLLKPGIRVYCVEPEGKELQKSLVAEEMLWEGEPKFLDTIADGLRSQKPGKLTFPILCKYAEKDVLTVCDADMIEGMKLSMKYLKQVIEASAGATVQALVKHNHIIPAECRNIGIILCGGNVDVDSMFFK